MLILALNCGSSSVKYQLVRLPERLVLLKGVVENISSTGVAGMATKHETAIEKMLQSLLRAGGGTLDGLGEIDAVGHRVVHGGEHFCESVCITPAVMQAITDTIPLAPLHNPANIAGMIAIRRLLPETPQVAVFDTAFYRTLPEHARHYALPYALCEKHRIRRYGFHGISHQYVARRAAEILNRDGKSFRIITCHLGNGASVTAVQDGRPVDTSMGYTPNEGLLMGTRSGDLDSGILLALAQWEQLSPQELDHLLNEQSGLLGVSGLSADVRVLESAAARGHPRARLALGMFCYRVRKYIGAYAAVMGGIEALVFTGGIGENSNRSRAAICERMEFIGLHLDTAKNDDLRCTEGIISAPRSPVTVMVIPTDEEMMIAWETFELQKNQFCHLRKQSPDCTHRGKDAIGTLT